MLDFPGSGLPARTVHLTYRHDPLGNRVAVNDNRFVYDGENRMLFAFDGENGGKTGRYPLFWGENGTLPFVLRALGSV